MDVVFLDFSELNLYKGQYENYSPDELRDEFEKQDFICFVLKKDVLERMTDRTAESDSLIVVLSGFLVFQKKNSSYQYFILGPGDAITIPENTDYDLLGVQAEPAEFFCCHRR
ncbi:MAG: cupin domain-containing protein [Candidatus Obscuribacterales bacterium]|jgi:mannose-6-phosphate isomerase-like protein (cupin superfamily)|nr:cupin domain-containing protein [Candidatus Obscuribacterales bacterium]